MHHQHEKYAVIVWITGGLTRKRFLRRLFLNTYFISPPRIFLWEKLIGNPRYNGECFMDLNQEFELRRENVETVSAQ